MIISITKIELNSYLKLIAFFKFNIQILNELKKSNCKKQKVTNNWTFKTWYTMTMWENEDDINLFYRNGTHLEAMKQSKMFSSKIKSIRIVNDDLLDWKDAKKLF